MGFWIVSAPPSGVLQLGCGCWVKVSRKGQTKVTISFLVFIFFGGVLVQLPQTSGSEFPGNAGSRCGTWTRPPFLESLKCPGVHRASFLHLFLHYYLFCSSAERTDNFSLSCAPPAQQKLPHPEIFFLWNILLISISKCAD